MKKFVIDENVLQSIMQYLYSRPYAEVANGIKELEKLKEIASDDDKD